MAMGITPKPNTVTALNSVHFVKIYLNLYDVLEFMHTCVRVSIEAKGGHQITWNQS